MILAFYFGFIVMINVLFAAWIFSMIRNAPKGPEETVGCSKPKENNECCD